MTREERINMLLAHGKVSEEQAALIAQALDEDPAASAEASRGMGELIHRGLRRKILGLLRGKIANFSVHEDLYQDIALEITKYLKTFSGRSKLDTWVFTIAWKVITRHYKEAKDQGAKEGYIREDGDGGDNPDDERHDDPSAQDPHLEEIVEQRLIIKQLDSCRTQLSREKNGELNPWNWCVLTYLREAAILGEKIGDRDIADHCQSLIGRQMVTEDDITNDGFRVFRLRKKFMACIEPILTRVDTRPNMEGI